MCVTYLDRGLVPPEPFTHLLRHTIEELEREVGMRLGILPILLRIPESLYDPRRDNRVLHCLLDLMLQVLRVLDI